MLWHELSTKHHDVSANDHEDVANTDENGGEVGGEVNGHLHNGGVEEGSVEKTSLVNKNNEDGNNDNTTNNGHFDDDDDDKKEKLISKTNEDKSDDSNDLNDKKGQKINNESDITEEGADQKKQSTNSDAIQKDTFYKKRDENVKGRDVIDQLIDRMSDRTKSRRQVTVFKIFLSKCQ